MGNPIKLFLLGFSFRFLTFLSKVKLSCWLNEIHFDVVAKKRKKAPSMLNHRRTFRIHQSIFLCENNETALFYSLLGFQCSFLFIRNGKKQIKIRRKHPEKLLISEKVQFSTIQTRIWVFRLFFSSFLNDVNINSQINF